METRQRSLVKALTWRIVATILTGLIALVITRETNVMMWIMLFDVILKLIAYYCHERVWLIIPYGKVQDPEYHI